MEELLGRELWEGPRGIGAPVKEVSTPSECIGLLGLQGSDSPLGTLKNRNLLSLNDILFEMGPGEGCHLRAGRPLPNFKWNQLAALCHPRAMPGDVFVGN